jgi:hypothetical protein
MLAQIGDTDDAELCKSILGISTAVYRPITLEELSTYVGLPEDVELSDLEEIIGFVVPSLHFEDLLSLWSTNQPKTFFVERPSTRSSPTERKLCIMPFSQSH